MATHRITINPLDPASVSSAAKEIERIKKQFEKNLELFFDRLAELGAQTAQSIFGGTTSVTVEKRTTGGRLLHKAQTKLISLSLVLALMLETTMRSIFQFRQSFIRVRILSAKKVSTHGAHG